MHLTSYGAMIVRFGPCTTSVKAVPIVTAVFINIGVIVPSRVARSFRLRFQLAPLRIVRQASPNNLSNSNTTYPDHCGKISVKTGTQDERFLLGWSGVALLSADNGPNWAQVEVRP